MLTPDQIDGINDRILQFVNPVFRWIVQDITERVITSGKATSTAAHKAQIARLNGADWRTIELSLQRVFGALWPYYKATIEDIGRLAYKQSTGMKGIPFKDNEALQNIIKAAIELAEDDFKNITQTIGMIGPYGEALPLREAYIEACDFAFKKVSTGAQDFQSAVREAVAGLVDEGLQVIEYQSGRHASVDVAVRRSVMGGMGLMVDRIEQQAFEDIGADGWEISAHEASAPDHEPIQGHQYSDNAYKVLNASLKRQIGTLNCKHIAFPIILGMNKPIYTNEQLEAMKRRNAEGIVYEGKKYTLYEATQKQRQIERNIRKQKRRIIAAEAAGDEKALLNAGIKKTVLEDRYKDFSAKAKLRTQIERLELIGYGPKQEKMIERIALSNI